MNSGASQSCPLCPVRRATPRGNRRILRKQSIFILLCACAFWTTTTRSEADPQKPWEWRRQEGKSLSLHRAGQTIWQLNHDPESDKPYFDPLALPDTGNLVWVSPPDHVWHYGLWFSWKYINGINYWEINPKTGKPDGTTRLKQTKILRTDNHGAELQLDFDFLPASGGDPLMTQTVRLGIETPRPDGSYAIDWHQTSFASAGLDITLDRTPPPDKPGGKGYGGYGGLSFRGARNLADVTVLDSEGHRNMDAHRQRARWLDTSGTIQGKQAGVTFFDHPSNPGHPNRWYVALAPLKDGPFTYMNPALLHDEPISVRAGQSLALRYRIWVHPGPADAKTLEAEFSAFSKQAHATEKSP